MPKIKKNKLFTIVSQTLIDSSKEELTKSLEFKNSNCVIDFECPLYKEVNSPDFIFQEHISPSSNPPYIEFSLKHAELN
jgi:hypothetical protein